LKIKNKILDDISKKLEKIEQQASERDNENLEKEEKEKLQRFGLYHVIRLEKYIRQGGDPTLGNLDPMEQTAEEFEYHLSHMLNDYTPEERYKQRKEMYYFHPSHIEMEKIDDWKKRAEYNYCNGDSCIADCPYYAKNGRIEDEQVISEFIDCTDIVELDDYKKDLGAAWVNSIVNEW
jgi:hypothetical protein